MYHETIATENIRGANAFTITSCFQQCLLWAHHRFALAMIILLDTLKTDF